MLCWTLKILTKMVPLSVMGCPVINSFSLSRNAVTVRFSWSRCETEFWGYLSGISSWKRKGREAGMNRKRKQTAMWVQQSLGQLGGGGGAGVTVASHGALGQVEMAGSCLPCSVMWPGDSCPGNARPWVRQVFSCYQKEVSSDHSSQPDSQTFLERRIRETHLLVFQSLPFAPLRSAFHVCFKGGSVKIAVGLSSWEII